MHPVSTSKPIARVIGPGRLSFWLSATGTVCAMRATGRDTLGGAAGA
jgi:hypothetical protein